VQFANPHKHTSTFAHFYPQQLFWYHNGFVLVLVLVHIGLYQFEFVQFEFAVKRLNEKVLPQVAV
jgi:hypothetical protein